MLARTLPFSRKMGLSEEHQILTRLELRVVLTAPAS